MDEDDTPGHQGRDQAGPSSNELRLGRRVLQLEKERDALAAELDTYRSRYPNHSTTIPVSESSTSTSDQTMTISNELMPVLALLRSHISTLTRDNEALRYTFLGKSPKTTDLPNPTSTPLASSSKVTLDVAMTPRNEPDLLPTETAEAVHHGVTRDIGQLDLEAVVGRVKELIRENEELGDMLLEVGRTNVSEWERALADSRAVIEALEADLAHFAEICASQRTEVESLKFRNTDLESAATRTLVKEETMSSSTATSSHRPSEPVESKNPRPIGLEIRGAGQRQSQAVLEKDRQGSVAGQETARKHEEDDRQRVADKERERDRERERGSYRDSDPRKGGGDGRRDGDRDRDRGGERAHHGGSSGSSLSRRDSQRGDANGYRGGRKDDDRMGKRRR